MSKFDLNSFTVRKIYIQQLEEERKAEKKNMKRKR